MKKQFYKNHLKKALVWLLIFVLAMPLASLAEIKSYTEQEATELKTEPVGTRATATGWVNSGGKWYYYIDGVQQSGWLYLNDGTYYLDPNNGGARVSGHQKIIGRHYYFNPDNNDRMHKGWLEQWHLKYYFLQDGVRVKGLALIDNVLHYFDANGIWRGEAQGWVMENGKWYFYLDGQKKTGRLFNDNKDYFLDRDTGEMRTGWIFDDADWYYADKNGVLATSATEIDGKVNFFNDFGFWLGTNGWQLKDGLWYYIINGNKVTGLHTVDGSTYFFDPTMYSSMTIGPKVIGNALCYFDSSGRRAEGKVVEIPGYGKFYFDRRGNGREAIGWVFENGKWYFKWADGTVVTGDLYYEGNFYRFDESGAMYTGWFPMGDTHGYALPSGINLVDAMYEIDGVMYYFNKNGLAFTAEGWLLQDGKWYFYNEGQKYKGYLIINGMRYFLNLDDGSMHTSWLYYDGIEYFKESGAAAMNETLTIDGVEYKFDKEGELVINGWFLYDGYWYYFDNGEKVVGWLDLNGVKYYLNPREWGEMSIGWLEIDTALYYFTTSGDMVKGTVWVEGKLCIFENNGMFYDYYKGWRKESGKWYYYENGERHIGWLELGTSWYYMFSDGTMAVGTVNAGGVMHVFDSNGVWQHAL